MASKKKRNRTVIAMHCSVCNSQNYFVRKLVKADYKLEGINRYCSNCRKHQVHNEKKIAKNN